MIGDLTVAGACLALACAIHYGLRRLTRCIDRNTAALRDDMRSQDELSELLRKDQEQ